MPSYIVTCKEDATDAEVQKIKDDLVSKGATIGHEYTLIKGFQVITPEVSAFSVDTLQTHPHVDAIELDQEVRTQ